MIVESSPAEPGRRPHRRFRFSLRTLIVLVTGLCVGLGFAYSNAKRQERAVADIEKAGGTVGYDWQENRTSQNSEVDPKPSGPVWLRKLLGPHYFDTVVSADMGRNQFKSNPKHFAPFGPPLAELPALKRLTIFNFELDDAEFAMIGRLKALEQIVMLNMHVTDHGAGQLALLPNLRELGLNDVFLSASAMAEFRKFPRLEDLWICCRHEDRGPHNEPIAELEKYALRDDALDTLPDFPRLRELSITFTQITDEGVTKLGRMPQLEVLELSSTHITNRSMQHLTKLQKLKWLGLQACGLDKEGIAKLAAFPNLTGLRISGRSIGNDCLPLIAQLGNLQKLDLGGDAIDDRGLHYLEGMKNLTFLDLQSTAVKTDGPAVQQLKKALPNCSIRQYYPSHSFRFIPTSGSGD